MSDESELLRRTAELAVEYLESLPDRPVRVDHDVADLRRALVTDLPEEGEDPAAVIEQLADVGGRAAVAMAGPRYFGFVIGGALPAAVAADWLTSAWDQNAGLYVGGPAASVVEEAIGQWLIDLFGLPQGSGYGLVTGCQMAHFTCLAAARQAVLDRGLGCDHEWALRRPRDRGRGRRRGPQHRPYGAPVPWPWPRSGAHGRGR